MLYFINATNEIMNKDGVKSITIRNIAEKAGYNSATLYNYFENLDHLIFYAAMRDIRSYPFSLKNLLENTRNAMDIYLTVWESFCNHAYDKPEVYNAIFFPKLDRKLNLYIEEYYDLFPEDLFQNNGIISDMLLKGDLETRSMTIVQNCVDVGYISQEDAKKLNDISLLIFEAMLKRVIMGKVTKYEAKRNNMDYLKSILKGFLIKDYDFCF